MKKIDSTKGWIFRSSLAWLLRISMCIAPGLALISCQSLPKETYLNSNCLTGIKKVVVITTIDTPEVSSSFRSTSVTAPLIPLFPLPALLAAFLEEGIKAGVDKNRAAKVSEHMDAGSIESKMAQSFIQTVKKGDCFQVIDYAKEKNKDNNKLSTTGYDAVIRLSVDEILLRQTAADYMSLTARVRGQLENLRSGEIVWDREEMVTNPEPHTLGYYEENGLTELDALLEKAGRNLAYDFLYLK